MVIRLTKNWRIKMVTIEKNGRFSWDSANNVSQTDMLRFAKHLIELSKRGVDNLPFEIAHKDMEKILKWDDANQYIESLGDGWRLPNNAELIDLYVNENDLEGSTYWGESVKGYSNVAMVQWLSSGTQALEGKGYYHHVRPVRDILK